MHKTHSGWPQPCLALDKQYIMLFTEIGKRSLSHSDINLLVTHMREHE